MIRQWDYEEWRRPPVKFVSARGWLRWDGINIGGGGSTTTRQWRVQLYDGHTVLSHLLERTIKLWKCRLLEPELVVILTDPLTFTKNGKLLWWVLVWLKIFSSGNFCVLANHPMFSDREKEKNQGVLWDLCRRWANWENRDGAIWWDHTKVQKRCGTGDLWCIAMFQDSWQLQTALHWWAWFWIQGLKDSPGHSKLHAASELF